MAGDKDENENSRTGRPTGQPCNCNQNQRHSVMSGASSLGEKSHPERQRKRNVASTSSINRRFSDSDESVFTHGESEDETVHRRSRTLTFRRKKNSEKSKDLNKKRKRFWTFRFAKRLPVRLKKHKDHGLPEPSQPSEPGACVCTGYRRTEDHVLGPGVVFNVQPQQCMGAGAGAVRGCSESSLPGSGCCLPGSRIVEAAAAAPQEFDLMQFVPAPAQVPIPDHLDFTNFNPVDFPTEDIGKILIAQRARDIELGIEIANGNQSGSSGNQSGSSGNQSGSPSASSSSSSSSSLSSCASSSQSRYHRAPQWARSSAVGRQHPVWNLSSAFQNQCVITCVPPGAASEEIQASENCVSEYKALLHHGAYVPRVVHTQVDYIHCLVPDLLEITNCSFYWGIMDRYEAETLLENRPEGTFLLRDSAQEEFLFSVSFRRYGRSLHARVEQWNHRFSFDSHDPGVFASHTVCGLIEHYKDPSCCMFFEPMLTLPLNRTFPFPLQHLCRAAICSTTNYDGVNFLPLPKPLRQYLKYYHYKQKVRVRKFECPH